MTDYEKFSELLRYDPESGSLFWKQCRPGRQIGKPAGHCDTTGYRRIMLDYKMYLAHRIIWLIHYKEWPKGYLDHIDRNPRNNKLENLREASPSLNTRNSKARSNSLTGHRGISLTRNGIYYVRLQGKYRGSATTLEKALVIRNRYNATH